MKAAKWWAMLVALVMIAAACGGGSDDGGDDASTDAGSSEDSSDNSSGDSSGDAADDSSDDSASDAAPGEVSTDFGVTDDEIRIGYNADLSGIFAASVLPIIEATEVYWEWVNDNGGVAGREVVPVILDNGYDVPKHLENYEIFSGDGADSVVMIGQSTGSPHTAATAELLKEDDLAAIPLTWYSGWADPDFGANVFEVQTLYCVESMNGITYMSETYGDKVAIISFPGEYGQDGATGAKMAAEKLGLEVVYDGEGAVVPGSDQTPVITEIVNSGADFVWATINPTTLSEIMGGAVAQGFTGAWAGNAPTYNPNLLDTDLKEALDQYYTHSTYTEVWNPEGSEGMKELIAQMQAYRPDAIVTDYYILGWVNGMIVQQVLEHAAENGDMTRAGVTQAAREITVDLKGLAPNQTWGGEPNDYIVRESYLYDVDSTKYTPDATVSDAGGGSGYTLIKGPYESPLAAEFDYTGPCFVAE
jgi:ABC-type branched-subunit amino acid transport system substrate-binding protein